MQLDGATSLVIVDSSAKHCFEQYSKIPNSYAIFEGSEFKVQLATGCKFHTGSNFLLPITLAPGLEHIINYCVADKLITPVILGM